MQAQYLIRHLAARPLSPTLEAKAHPALSGPPKGNQVILAGRAAYGRGRIGRAVHGGVTVGIVAALAGEAAIQAWLVARKVCPLGKAGDVVPVGAVTLRLILITTHNVPQAGLRQPASQIHADALQGAEHRHKEQGKAKVTQPHD